MKIVSVSPPPQPPPPNEVQITLTRAEARLLRSFTSRAVNQDAGWGTKSGYMVPLDQYKLAEAIYMAIDQNGDIKK